jgi:hypothetical protein
MYFNIFGCNLTTRMRKLIHYYGKPCKIQDLSPEDQYKILISSLYVRVSKHFRRKLYSLLKQGKLHHVQQWFNTTDGILIPLVLTYGSTNYDYKIIDRIVKCSLENCANNYAVWQTELKSFRKTLRKEYSKDIEIDFDEDTHSIPRSCYFLKHLFKRFMPRNCELSEQYMYVLMWSQTRGTGLANGEMQAKSLEKFVNTITKPSDEITMDGLTLLDITEGARYSRGVTAKLSIGPTAVLESTRQAGGGTAFVESLCRKTISYRYDFRTLERLNTEPHRVSTSEDILSLCIEQALTDPESVLKVRAHTVLEPGKARVITVASGYYQLMQGVMAHIYMPCIRNRFTDSGLSSNRHMWNFMSTSLGPESKGWSNMDSLAQKFGLSTDLSEATDYGNISVARQLYSTLNARASGNPEFPSGFAELCCRLFCSPRQVIVGNRVYTKTRGWFMGDYMTKVILTLAQMYALKRSRIPAASIVGDDFVGISNDPDQLVRHLQVLKELDFQISWKDTYLSKRFIFFTEEGAIIPQKAWDLLYHRMKRGALLPYVDYPRTRLLLPVLISTDRYSSTNVGRFSLLGKECLYVHRTAKEKEYTFTCASLMQHMLLSQDADTLCPFTPIEIGGDGAYTPNSSYLYDVIRDKARDPHRTEVQWRMRKSLTHGYMPSFYRSAHTTKTVEKYNLVVLISEEIKMDIPSEALIVPRNNTEKSLLRSFRGKILKDPIWYWAKIREADFYKSILNGHRVDPPPLPSLARQYRSKNTVIDNDYIIVEEFNSRVGERGLPTFTNYPYYVRSDRVEHESYLNLGWNWNEQFPSEAEELRKEVLDFLSANEADILTNFRNLPPKYEDDIHLVMDPDVVVEYAFRHKIDELERDKKYLFVLVTNDWKLARELVEIPRYEVQDQVYYLVIDPLLWMTGRLYVDLGMDHSIPLDREMISITDAGSTAYTRTLLAAGVPDSVEESVVNDTAALRSYLHNEDITKLMSASYTWHEEFRAGTVIHFAKAEIPK